MGRDGDLARRGVRRDRHRDTIADVLAQLCANFLEHTDNAFAAHGGDRAAIGFAIERYQDFWTRCAEHLLDIERQLDERAAAAALLYDRLELCFCAHAESTTVGRRQAQGAARATRLSTRPTSSRCGRQWRSAPRPALL